MTDESSTHFVCLLVITHLAQTFNKAKDVAFHGIYFYPMETKEEGYKFYRLDAGKEQTRRVFECYETYPEDVLIKLHAKYINEIRSAVKLKRSKYDDEPLVNLRRNDHY